MDMVFIIGSSPYLVNVSSLSSGIHSITFNAIVNGVVRGSATQSFIVSEGAALLMTCLKWLLILICFYIRCACGIQRN